MTLIKYWWYRLTGQRRKAGGILAARTRRLNKVAREAQADAERDRQTVAQESMARGVLDAARGQP